MRSLTSATRPARSWTVSPPSPAARARASTLTTRLRTFVLIGVARGAEEGRVGVVGAEGPHQVGPALAEVGLPPGAERGGVGGLGWAEAGVAAPLVRGADGAAAGLGDRPQAGRAVGGHHADRAAALALEA